jgi:hypothetical protein
LRLPDANGRSTYARQELMRDLRITEAMGYGSLPMLGPPSSLGDFHFGPAYYYLLFPLAYLFSFSLYSLALTSLAFSIAAIALAFHVAETWWRDRRLAHAVAAMISLSILDVQVAKYASNPNFVPFFSLLFFFSLERLMRDAGRKRWWFLLGLSFAVVTQLHAVPLIAFPVVLAVAAFRRSIRVTLAGAAIFSATLLVAYAPYLSYEITHGFANVRSLFSFAGPTSSLALSLGHVVQYAGFIVAPWLSLHPFFDVASLWGSWLFVAIALAAFGAYLVLRRDLRRERAPSSAIPRGDETTVTATLRLWFVVPTMVLLAPIAGKHDFPIYYFFALSPLLYLLYALGLRRMRQRGLAFSVAYLWAVFIVLQVSQIMLYGRVVAALQ